METKNIHPTSLNIGFPNMMYPHGNICSWKDIDKFMM